MISYLRIQRFKCFEDQTIQFGNLTLLAGGNASGKSTVIQVLLVLRQSNETGGLQVGELSLNGKYAKIGTAKDALYSHSQEDSLAFTITDEDATNTVTFEFDYQRGEPEAHTLFDSRKPSCPSMNLFDKGLTYLSAERLGPRLLYPITDVSRGEMNVGIQGEYTAHCLAEFGNERIHVEELAFPDTDNLLFRHQTELWMRCIVPNLGIEIAQISEADRVRMGLRNKGDTDFWRPTNVGFGVSYTLPVIVAALMAKPGSILIVENPEAHLHPAGQSELARFLARTATTGVQVIIETHSDHILNGVRLAVRRRLIRAEDISIQFFTQSDEEAKYEVIVPNIDSDGRIDRWPEGFFDQIEKDLMELF